MKILLTNDDGWDAPGLAALKKVVDGFAECWVVAPTDPQSGISHQLTLNRKLNLLETSPRCFQLDGTPADCTRIGLTQLDVDFDWVLAGINDGANLGADIFVSGTVAAAREAWLMGKRSIAFSQYRHRLADWPSDNPFDWTTASELTTELLKHFFDEDYWQPDPLPERCLINVNFPDMTQTENWSRIEMVSCSLDPNPLPSDYNRDSDGQLAYNGNYRERQREPDCDVDVCFSGRVAITPLE